MEPQPPVGFVGLGVMGAPMAGHLRRAGWPLFVHTRTRSRAEPLLAAGAVWCDTPEQCAAACRVLCLALPDAADVEQVLFGPHGAAGALRPGTVVVDFSTIAPQAARQIAGRLGAGGVQYLDAPVTGGDVGAQQATLTIMVGGDERAFAQVRPLLETLGRRVVRVGPSGSGQALKACNQVLCAVNLIGVCEALLLARRCGLDPAQAVATLCGGAGSSWAWEHLAPRILAGDDRPGFMVRLLCKDLRIVRQMADELELPMPGSALARELFAAAACLPDGPTRGTQALYHVYERLAGG